MESVKKSDGKWYLTKVKQTIYKFGMIQDGDTVVVGLSGGKDSAVLLHALVQFRRQAKIKFDLKAVFVDLGWPLDRAPLLALTSRYGVPLHIEETPIARIVFERRQEKNPCALCSNLRRGALNQAALQLEGNKVALGHHLDDAIETFLMNLIFTGQMGTFKPVTFLDRTGITQIRPLIQLPGRTVESLARREGLEILPNPCPASGATRRREMTDLVAKLCSRYPDLREKMRTAFLASFWKEKI